ncbi:Leucyltransferase [Alteripontixanthobacter maritimus]|uniref:Leucyl/phenylalanyl-tRNA--protein transferase n=1 Tax=Alteripontixanthobacter maritimus TaxID=2161824 RepID=A0A369Q7D0_9SPHN|nr:leucyl/phenylalanyl-tRNA--protein transferase [Alteripontixanthobacter maritimus]RDC60614.1 Leucyltransferase [Alteripontixanthobacter maritimus]
MHAVVTPPPIPVETLLLAYRSGVFPMSDGRDDPEVFWVEPRERAVLPLGGFRLSSSLRKALRQDRFDVRIDTAFAQVMAHCAAPRPDHSESWISQRIMDSYQDLHRAGHAHSLECWQDGELVGGLYGVSFDRVFCGESMFTRADNASKVALAWLVALMRRAGFGLLDCQFMTDHLASLGAAEMPQAHYVNQVRQAGGPPSASLPEAYASLLAEASSSSSASSEGDAGLASPGKLIAQSLTHTS